MTDSQIILKLRQETGASFNYCKEAVAKFPGDYEKAKEYLTELLKNTSGKRGEKETRNGIIEVYTHAPVKGLACMVEVLCETDFVAKNEEFHKFAHEVALQIVAASPIYVDESSIPQDELAKLKAQWEADVASSGKPAQIVEKIIQGKLEKYLSEVSLLDQVYFKDDSLKVRDLLKMINSKLGENIKISRFTRWQI